MRPPVRGKATTDWDKPTKINVSRLFSSSESVSCCSSDVLRKAKALLSSEAKPSIHGISYWSETDSSNLLSAARLWTLNPVSVFYFFELQTHQVGKSCEINSAADSQSFTVSSGNKTKTTTASPEKKIKPVQEKRRATQTHLWHLTSQLSAKRASEIDFSGFWSNMFK